MIWSCWNMSQHGIIHLFTLKYKLINNIYINIISSNIVNI